MLDGETKEEKGTVEQLLVSPLRYFTDACLDILLKGAGVGLSWDSILGILLVGGTAAGFDLWRFRRQFE